MNPLINLWSAQKSVNQLAGQRGESPILEMDFKSIRGQRIH